MKRNYFLFLSMYWVLFLPIYAQQPNAGRDTLFEKTTDGLVRFYFDAHYYLVEKDCPFKSIERVSGFTSAKNMFQGVFKDFDNNGNLILTGYYDQGKKEGVFRAFHSNGVVKWETNFVDDRPTGEWKYYYPDGKPMLVVASDSSSKRILSFWDRLGRPKVQNGNGNYIFKMPFEFYNEYGFPFFERKGKIRDGYLFGYWTTHLVDENNKKVLLTEENYGKGGVFIEGYNLFLDASYTVPFAVTPALSFYTAEKLLSKPCTFDDFSGFNTYLTDRLNAASQFPLPYKNKSETFAFKVAVDKDGNSGSFEISDPLQIQEINEYLEQILQDIPFYFPSLDPDGKAIADILTVSGRLDIDDDGIFLFHSIHIEREKQPL